MSLLVAVLGPTGSGKSDLALSLAETFRGEIVNCDSVQLYRYLDIGTAKTPLALQRGVPHHLLDILDPDQVAAAGDYSRLARPLLAEIAARRALPVVAGGTGFYLRALLDGLFPGPQRDEAVRQRLIRRPQRLHRLLGRLDPLAAARIHENDIQKLIRALEVCILARRPVTAMHGLGREPLKGFEVLKIGLDPPRDQLYARLNARCVEIFERGIEAEVQSILARGFPPESKAFESIGYKEALLSVQGMLPRAEAIERAQIATRQYAKRQLTWFRRETGVHWIRAFGNQTQTIEAAKGLVSEQRNLEEINLG